MKYYYRIISKRVLINRFGKLGFKPYMEVVLTDDITEFNYRKRIKFEEMTALNGLRENELESILNANVVYEFEREW